MASDRILHGWLALLGCGSCLGGSASGGPATHEVAAGGGTASAELPRPDPAPPAAAPRPSSRVSCLAAPHVPELASTPTLAGLFRAADADDPRIQLLFSSERPGRTPDVESEVARLEPLRARLSAELASATGVRDVGVRSCRSVSNEPREICLGLELPLCSEPLSKIAEALARVLPAGAEPAPRVGLRVEYTGLLEPRCSSTRADCLPLPYHPADTRAELKRAGFVTPPFSPELPREPVRFRSESGPLGAGPGLSLGACGHDGECVRMGCGNHCAAWDTPPFAAGCPAFADLRDAHCGCVEGRCLWFTQQPQLQLDRGAVEASDDAARAAAQRLLQNPRLDERLVRCHRQHPAPLPRQLHVQLVLDRLGHVRGAELPGEPRAFAACLLPELKKLTGPRFEGSAERAPVAIALTLRER